MFGKLNKNSVKAMDENMKVMIAGTMRALRKASGNGPLTWDKVMATMSQCPVLEAADGKVDRSGHLYKDSKAWFRLDHSPREGIVQEVRHLDSKCTTEISDKPSL